MAAKKWKPTSRRSEMTSGRSAPGCWKGNGPSRTTTVKEHLRGAGHAKKLNDIQGFAGQNVDNPTGGGRSSGAFDGVRNCYGKTEY